MVSLFSFSNTTVTPACIYPVLRAPFDLSVAQTKQKLTQRPIRRKENTLRANESSKLWQANC